MTRPLPALILALLIVGSAVAGGQVLAKTGPAGPGWVPEQASTVEAVGDSTNLMQTGPKGGVPAVEQPEAGSAVEQPDVGPSAMEPVEGTSPNTTRVLQLDSTEAAGFDRGGLTVTNALRASTANAEATMQVYAAETAIDRASDSAAKERALRNATEQLTLALDALETREERARSQYVAGTRSAREYLNVLGETNTRASRLQSLILGLQEVADGQPAIQNRLNDLQTRTLQHQGPLRDDLGAAVTGAGSTERLYVGASGQGVVLATIQDGTYVRGAVRADARDEAIGGVDLDAAQDRIAALYPWAWSNNAGVSIRSIGQDVFRFQLGHGHGSLDSLLDTSSGNVYREIQQKSLSRTPAEPTYRQTANNTTVVVSRTYAGGPVNVRVQNATGVPLPATVAVNGTVVGQTDEDGSVWAISPAGSYTVTARSEAETLNVTVTSG